jgi:flagellar biogenesis protein FliO
MGARGGGGLPKNVVQILGRTPVAPRQHLVLLRFGSKLVLVSMVQGEARTISEITDPLEVDQLAGMCESQQSTSVTHSFREILAQGVKA